MKSSKYFARYGKVYGPYSLEEVEELHATGGIREFFWVWDESQASWLPMDPAPPPLQLGRPAELSRPTLVTKPPSKKPEAPAVDPSTLEVVCHNKHQFMTARIGFMTQTGCELTAREGSSSPLFPDNAPVILNILDAGTQRLLNVKARICGISRSKSGWTYQLRWEAPPKF